MPELPDDIILLLSPTMSSMGTSASTMEVKMQSGQTQEEPTLPYLLRHLPKYKAPGYVGDRHKHCQVMPFALVEVLIHDALNGDVSDGFASIWRAGLLHPGDKQKKDSQDRPVARPIVVGLAARRMLAVQTGSPRMMATWLTSLPRLSTSQSVSPPSSIRSVNTYCYGTAPVILCIISAGLSLQGWHKASHPNTMKLYSKELDEFCLLKHFPLSSRPD